MKIFLYGIVDIFSADLVWGFRELGHEVILKYPNSIEEYDQIISDYNPDLIMSFGSPVSYTNRIVLSYIGRRKVEPSRKYVHWDTDGISWVNIELSLIQISKPDIVFTICPDMLELLKAQHIECYILPYAFSPLTHYPCPRNKDFEGMITFAGGSYPEVMAANPNHLRIKSMNTLISPLLKNNIRVDFWGDARFPNVFKQFFNCDIQPEWNHARCIYELTNGLYNGCFINIVPQNHNYHLTKRTFEILGAGGFILTYDTQEIRRLFTPQKELAVSSSPEQTLELVKYYRNDPAAYEEVRKNSLEAAKNHTYKQRVEFIISKLA